MRTFLYSLVAVVVGLGLVYLGLVFSAFENGAIGEGGGEVARESERPEASLSRATEDVMTHRYGNPEADITIFEFSDAECPFCARVHGTLQRLVDESGGEINWEYRHLPLSIHPNAHISAVASECVAELSGNDMFWSYLELVFSQQSDLSRDMLIATADDLAVPQEEFISCLDSDRYDEQIEADMAIAAAYGGSGTPFSVIRFADGTIQPVSGALPYEAWKQLLSQ